MNQNSQDSLELQQNWFKEEEYKIRKIGFEKWWNENKEMVVLKSGIKRSIASAKGDIRNLNLSYLYQLASNDNSNDIPDQKTREIFPLTSSISPDLIEQDMFLSEKIEIEHIKHYVQKRFDNWGDNVSNVPFVTFVPNSKNEIIQIVKWAKSRGKRVRCSGCRHTWNNMYSDNDEVLICMIPLEQSAIHSDIILGKISGNIFNHYPQNAKHDNSNDLLNIELIRKPVPEIKVLYNAAQKGLVKIGASVTNEAFRSWCIRNDIAIPMNVIMVEITIGGANAPICHGAGINNETLSDIVHAIEIIDHNGKIRSFNRNDHTKEMSVLSGSFGLCGVIVSVTLEVDYVSYAVLKPYKPLLEEGIPKPENCIMHNPAYTEFRKLILDSYYNEFFWFPPSDRLWINCWNNNGIRKDAVEYPSHIEKHLQEASGALGEFANNTLFKLFSAKIQQDLFSHVAMASLPGEEVSDASKISNDDIITTHIMNGLHFRRGIHNMRVRDYEIEIPIPCAERSASAYDLNLTHRDSNSVFHEKLEPDLQFVARLWWDAMDLINEYASRDKYPIQVALEMRIMSGSSKVLMAPQRGNKWTCAIEVLTTMNVSSDKWIDFISDLNSKWLNNSLIGRLESEGLYCRPHWAKEWDTMIIKDMPADEYVKYVYAKEINLFKYIRSRLQMDPINMFSNKLLDRVFDLKFSSVGNSNLIKLKKEKTGCCDII